LSSDSHVTPTVTYGSFGTDSLNVNYQSGDFGRPA
jgi:hypothetical protein